MSLEEEKAEKAEEMKEFTIAELSDIAKRARLRAKQARIEPRYQSHYRVLASAATGLTGLMIAGTLELTPEPKPAHKPVTDKKEEK